MKQTNILMALLVITIILQIVYAEDVASLGRDDIYDRANSLLSSKENRLSMIFPSILLVISLIAVAIDFGAIGVIIASMGSLVILTWLGLVTIGWVPLISFVIMCGLLVFKIQA
jgi:hypothetical protein